MYHNLLTYGAAAAADVTSDPTVAWIALFLGPLSAIVVAFIASSVNRKNGKESGTVAQKEAATHEFAVLIDGFTDQISSMREDITAARAEAKEAKTEAATANSKVTELTGRVRTLEFEKGELIAHIELLENTIPTPPGPPPRPFSWRGTR